MENTKAVSQTEGKEIAEVSDDEIATLMAQNAQLQAKENEGDGVKADYILLSKSHRRTCLSKVLQLVTSISRRKK